MVFVIGGKFKHECAAFWRRLQLWRHFTGIIIQGGLMLAICVMIMPS
jgi:hypothetical protein